MFTNSLILSRLWSQKKNSVSVSWLQTTTHCFPHWGHGTESLSLNRFSQDYIWSAGWKYYKHFQNDPWIFHDFSPEYVFIHLLFFSPCQNKRSVSRRGGGLLSNVLMSTLRNYLKYLLKKLYWVHGIRLIGRTEVYSNQKVLTSNYVAVIIYFWPFLSLLRAFWIVYSSLTKKFNIY